MRNSICLSVKMFTDPAQIENVRLDVSVGTYEFGLGNRKWEELTKDIPGWMEVC